MQNQDLFALGIGNMLSACFSTFVAAGSFGRTALAQVGKNDGSIDSQHG